MSANEFLLSAEEVAFLFFFMREPLPPIAHNPFDGMSETDVAEALERLIATSDPDGTFVVLPDGGVTLREGLGATLERCGRAEQALLVLSEGGREVLYVEAEDLVTFTDAPDQGYVLRHYLGVEAQQALERCLNLRPNPADSASFVRVRAEISLDALDVLMRGQSLDGDEVETILRDAGVPLEDGFEILRQTQAPGSFVVSGGIPRTEAATAFVARDADAVRIVKMGVDGAMETALLAKCSVDEAIQIILER